MHEPNKNAPTWVFSEGDPREDGGIAIQANTKSEARQLFKHHMGVKRVPIGCNIARMKE